MEDKHTTQKNQNQTLTSSGEDCHPALLRFNMLMISTQHLVHDYKLKSNQAVLAKKRMEEMMFSLLRAKMDISSVKETWMLWESDNFFIQRDLDNSCFDSTGNLKLLGEIIERCMANLNDTHKDLKIEADIDDVFQAVECQHEGEDELIRLCFVIINEWSMRDDLPMYQLWTADDVREAKEVLLHIAGQNHPAAALINEFIKLR